LFVVDSRAASFARHCAVRARSRIDSRVSCTIVRVVLHAVRVLFRTMSRVVKRHSHGSRVVRTRRSREWPSSSSSCSCRHASFAFVVHAVSRAIRLAARRSHAASMPIHVSFACVARVVRASFACVCRAHRFRVSHVVRARY
jgi:hypothetical protein